MKTYKIKRNKIKENKIKANKFKKNNLKECLLVLLSMGALAGCTRYTPLKSPSAVELEFSAEHLTVQETMEHAEAETADVMERAVSGAKEQELSATQETRAGNLRTSPGMLQLTDDDETMLSGRTPVKVKGIYISAYVAGNEAMMDNIIKQIDKTELNAVVIDFKTDEGHIAAKVNSPVFQEIAACRDYIPNLSVLMKKLKEHNIYTIARVVAFKDPYLAERKPEWCLKTADGSVYRDKKGLAWVSPYRKEVWDYLVEVGSQAGKAGFDEVQFDYIRFATDSTMKQVVFDEAEAQGRSKTDIITEFTEYASEKLTEQGLFVSADVFGAIIGSEEDANAVGQIYGDMASHMDYICPMIYPSHYGDGNFGLDHPDLHPYETILGALQDSREDLSRYDASGGQAIVRPWLQDFTASYLKHYIPYRDEELRLQIQAVYDAGYEEWILWNAANKYHYGGLMDEESTEAGGEIPAF